MNAPRLGFPRFVRAAFASFSSAITLGLSSVFGASLDTSHPGVRIAMAVQAEMTPGWMASDSVLGTAIGGDESGNAVVIVYVDRNHAAVATTIRSIPVRVRGVGVRIEATDRFRAFKSGPTAGATTTAPSHTAVQTGAILLGTSGGWSLDLANGYCCGGTLGGLVKDKNGTQYILSNYHVFEADIVPGGNGVTAAPGDPIIQPGLIDVGCSVGGASTVANLVKVSSLQGSNVDCSIAQVVTGKVDANGAILEVGALSSATAGAYVTQPVKKSGRTTGLTRSTVSGVNATIRVTYDNECAGGVAFTKTFSNQIVIANRGSKFLNSGDSGSVLLEDASTNPRAVGLLFAGSSTSAIANPIGEVLSFLATKLPGPVTMVGTP